MFLQFVDRGDLLRADANDQVAGLNARARGRTGRVFDDETVVADFLFLVRRQRTKREAQLAALVARTVVRLRNFFFVERRDGRGDIHRLAVAPQLERNLRSRRRVANAARDIGTVVHRHAVDLADDVTGLDSRLFSRAALFDGADERTVGIRQAKTLRERLVQLLDADAQTAVADLAVRLQLIGNLRRNVRGNRKRQSHEAAGTTVDLGVDADDLSGGVEQRSTRVAGIDGDVGLNDRRHLAAGQRAVHAAHDTGRNAVLEAERRADRNDPLTLLDARRRRHVERGQVLGVDLDQRDVRARIGPDDLRREFAAIGQLDRHFTRTVDDVRVGDDVAIGTHDESGAQSLRRNRLRHLRNAILSAEALEEFAERAIGVDVVGIETGDLRLADDADIDDRAARLLRQHGEIRQARSCRGCDGNRRGYGSASVRKRRPVEFHVARRKRRTDAGRGERVGDFGKLHRATPRDR